MQSSQGSACCSASRPSWSGARPRRTRRSRSASSTSTRRSRPPTEGKAAREEFARKQREAEAKLQPMLDRYKELEEDLKTKKFVLSDDALFQKQLDLAEMRNQIQNKMKELEGQLQVDQKRLEGPLTKKLVDIIEDVGQGRGLHADLPARHAGPALHARGARHHRRRDREVQPEGLRRRRGAASTPPRSSTRARSSPTTSSSAPLSVIDGEVELGPRRRDRAAGARHGPHADRRAHAHLSRSRRSACRRRCSDSTAAPASSRSARTT